jgi:hypothetical protein
MILQEVLRLINFNIGTWDDISGRAINPIVSNQIIIDQLNSQLKQYANITKGIQDVYSFPLNRHTVSRPAPLLSLRSESYLYIGVIVNGTRFEIDMRPPKEVFNTFRVNTINGIPNWFMPWFSGKEVYLSSYPSISTDAHTTSLSSNISVEDTTISVASTSGFITGNGRITIENEVILYEYTDGTNFYNCKRGCEMTEVRYHASGTIITENNVYIFYARLPKKIVLNDEQMIPQQVLQREIEVVEEHLEGIIKAVSYNILIKLDAERASVYKVDYEQLYDQYRRDITKGVYAGRIGTNFREQYATTESGAPYGNNLIY